MHATVLWQQLSFVAPTQPGTGHWLPTFQTNTAKERTNTPETSRRRSVCSSRSRNKSSGKTNDVPPNAGGSQTTAGDPKGSAMTFAQRATATQGTNGITHDGMTCHRCNETGHYASDCPTDTSSAASGTTTLVQYGLTLAQGTSGIDPSWIFLDSQSTISVFCNADMLTNIRPSDHVLRAVTSGSH